MRKIVLVYGTIAGILMDLLFFISFWLMDKKIITMEHSEIFGYTTMIIVMSLIFMGVKSYRDNHQNGTLTFWNGLKPGLLITLIASLFYAGGWEIYYNTVPNVKETFLKSYAESVEKKMRADGAGQEKIDAKLEELRQMAEYYKNPLFRFGMTLMEIMPVGIIVALISAGVLRRKGAVPAA